MSNLVKLGDEFIRTEERDGATWYALPDILKLIDSKTSTTVLAKIIRQRLGVDSIRVTELNYGVGSVATNMTTEAGFYFTILYSKKPKAQTIMPKLLGQIRDSKLILEALNDFEVPEELPDMYVYAIREQETGRVKLGISKDPEQRLRTLQTGNSSKLELVAYKKAENRFKDEQQLHKLAANEHIRGEWFEGGAVRLVA